MHVGIVKSRQEGSAGKVDHPGPRSRHGKSVGIATDEGYGISSNDQGGNRLLAFHQGVDNSTVKYPISGGGAGSEKENQEGPRHPHTTSSIRSRARRAGPATSTGTRTRGPRVSMASQSLAGVLSCMWGQRLHAQEAPGA